MSSVKPSNQLTFVIHVNRISDKDHKIIEMSFPASTLVQNIRKFIPEDDTLNTLKYYSCKEGLHTFVMIETSKYFWSLEKYSEGIILQRSDEQKAVVDYDPGKRSGPINNAFTTDDLKASDLTMMDVLKWLVKKNELSRSYSLLFDNCRSFARRLITAHSSEEAATTFFWDVTVQRKGKCGYVKSIYLCLFTTKRLTG